MLSRENQEERMAGKDHLVIYFNKPGKKQRKQWSGITTFFSKSWKEANVTILTKIFALALQWVNLLKKKNEQIVCTCENPCTEAMWSAQISRQGHNLKRFKFRA